VLSGHHVDPAATAALRVRLRAAKTLLRLVKLDGDEYHGSRRVVEIGPRAAQQQRLADGDLIEFPCSDGPSLLAWVRIDTQLTGDVCRVGPSGLAILGLAPGDAAELRPIRANNA
jgi:hypothetical protein